MALRVVPRHEQFSLSNNNEATINQDAVVGETNSPPPILPDAVVERATDDNPGRCTPSKRVRIGFFVCFAILVGIGVAVSVVVSTRNGRQSSSSSDKPGNDNPTNDEFDIGGTCFIGDVLLDCSRGVPMKIPDCAVESYDEYKQHWIPLLDPTFDYEADSCAPSNLGLIVSAAQGIESNAMAIQTYALTTFFVSMNGIGWINRTKWLSSSSLEQWEGLKVDNSSGKVVGIDLSDNFLEGTLPPQLGLLSGIETLRLYNNAITGTIPWEYGVFVGVRLSSNFLTGTIPAEWDDDASLSTNLKSLSLDINLLTGSVPYMAQLEELLLSHNDLTSTISVGTSLRVLDIHHNQFEGTIQENLGTALVYLALEGNLWDQSAFSLEALKKLPDLAFLTADNMGLRGTIPTEIGNCRNMTVLNLDRNQLTGQLPTELGLLASLDVLDLELSSMNGTLPSELGNVDALRYLFINRNDFTGTLPTELGSLTNLREFLFAGNELSGVIPSEICSLWDVGELNRFGGSTSQCRVEEFYGGVSCPSQECCRNYF